MNIIPPLFWQRIAALVSVMTVVGGIVVVFARSDAPPLASIRRVDDTAQTVLTKVEKKIDATNRRLIEGQIRNMWAQCVNAMKRNDAELANNFAAELAALQTDYERVNQGQPYPLNCQ